MDTSLYIVAVLGLAIVLGLLLVAAILWFAPVLPGLLRARPLREVAESQGLRFDRKDRFQLRSYPLDRLLVGRGPRCQNIISSESGGKKYLVFELSVREPLFEESQSETTNDYTCALARINANCPMLKIVPRDTSEDGDADQTYESLVAPVRTEDFEFDKAFRIFARDPNVASAVLPRTLGRWLIEQPMSWCWEVHDAFILAWTPGLLPPAEVVDALGVIRGFLDQLPAELERTYPPGPTSVDKLADTAAADFRGGRLPAEEALAKLESARAAADSVADLARYTRLIDEVTATRVRQELARLGRGTEL